MGRGNLNALIVVGPLEPGRCDKRSDANLLDSVPEFF